MRASITRLGEDGIEVLNLVVPKPEIPEDIAHNYKQVKVQWTEQLVAAQTQKTEEIKKKTELVKVRGSVVHSHWSSSYITALSLAESFIVLLRQGVFCLLLAGSL